MAAPLLSKVVRHDWNGHELGDAYLALKRVDRIQTEGVVEEGWAIGHLYELNGSMRSQAGTSLPDGR